MHRISLLSVIALGALAVMAPSAGAVIEVSQEEETSTLNHHCPAVTMPTAHTVAGGCKLHITAEFPAGTGVDILTEAGTLITRCTNEFDARINEKGEGEIYNQVLAGAGCFLRDCREDPELATKKPWHFQVVEMGGGQLEFVYKFCIETVASPHPESTCTIHLDIDKPTPHTVELEGNDKHCTEGNGLALKNPGHWILENQAAGEHVKDLLITHP